MNIFRIANKVASSVSIVSHEVEINKDGDHYDGFYLIKGVFDGHTFELQGKIYLNPEVVEDVDYRKVIPNAVIDAVYEFDNITVDGVKVTDVNYDEYSSMIDSITESIIWTHSINKIVAEADEKFLDVYGDDFLNDYIDDLMYAKDPYAYYGLKKSDFY